ncbi:universal stress protein [Halorussus amylolyticus]|uniref:universal stress protein n=1 Tax=Halorussus amylolyticus TaxID=1126242 RepID=UPI00104A1BAB|nr:universal stress protein [Halorussus amylolyticus]
MYDTILFPTDGSDGTAAALENALDVAESYDATVHALYVADTGQYSTVTTDEGTQDVLMKEGEDIVGHVAERGRDRGVEVEDVVLQGDPYETIRDYIEEYDVDLVVMGTHGRRGVERVLIGSLTEKVVRTADVPVLTVPLADPD